MDLHGIRWQPHSSLAMINFSSNNQQTQEGTPGAINQEREMINTIIDEWQDGYKSNDVTTGIFVWICAFMMHVTDIMGSHLNEWASPPREPILQCRLFFIQHWIYFLLSSCHPLQDFVMAEFFGKLLHIMDKNTPFAHASLVCCMIMNTLGNSSLDCMT